jgi:hypothetical protein
MPTFCTSCGKQVESSWTFCPTCSAKVGTATPNEGVSVPSPPAQIQERFFLQGVRGVSVSNTRLAFPGRTYALANVSSVSLNERFPNSGGGVGLAAIGALIALLSLAAFGGSSWGWGLFLLVTGIGCVVLGIKLSGVREFIVRLHTAGGESDGLTTRDGQLAQQVVQAIEQAIVARG